MAHGAIKSGGAAPIGDTHAANLTGALTVENTGSSGNTGGGLSISLSTGASFANVNAGVDSSVMNASVVTSGNTKQVVIFAYIAMSGAGTPTLTIKLKRGIGGTVIATATVSNNGNNFVMFVDTAFGANQTYEITLSNAGSSWSANVTGQISMQGIADNHAASLTGSAGVCA